MSALDDDWSDSDEETGAGTETEVLLGIPDGRMETDADVKDAAVSRIGGLPAFLLSREPPFSSSQCKVCSDPMELLVQVWCPFEQSPMDRALYIWGCARSSCQRQSGSIRAWRGLRYNAAYAAKLTAKQARGVEERNALSSLASNITNPFSVNATDLSTISSLGSQIFGNPTVNVDRPAEQDNDEDGDAKSDDGSLITAMACTREADSFWAAAPIYPATYLSTVTEYIPQPTKAKTRAEDPVGRRGDDVTWAVEMYERPLETDIVFDRFSERVGHAGDQCIRYELKGTPLPFASDRVFETLFPVATQGPLPVTKAGFKVVSPTRRSYSTASIPPCPRCQSSRVFECQLMPNLINVLGDCDTQTERMTDEQRIKAVQDALRRNKDGGSRGMEWGTCMIFCCANDCCLDDGGDGECWREEYVLVQWDD